VTEPKAVLRALAESEERFRIAARIAGDLISEADVETGEVTWYGDVDSALGYEPGEFPRTIEGWLNHLHPADRGRVAKLMARDVFGARRALALDCRIRTKRGDYRHWRIHGVPRSAEEAKARKFVGVSVDVTDQLQLEAETELHREELAHVDRVGLLGEMHVALAHELNQPLTAILSNAQAGLRQLDQDSVNTDELRDILSDIVSNDRRAGDVIKQLRTMVRRQTTERKLVDVNSLIAAALRLVRSNLTIRSIDLETELEPGLPRATVDSIQIQQVLMNLIMNAIDALRDQAPNLRSIVVSSQHDESHITVSVRDTGQGIAEAAIPNLFDSFYTSKPEGIGVGLAISRRLVDSHGGRLWLAATSPAGTRMSFTLPIAESREQ
jgi:PAS domain S-box-containing protein